MTIELADDLATFVTARAAERGVTPAEWANEVLRARLLSPPSVDEWKRRLASIATDCGVSLTDEQLSRENIYE